MRRRDFITLVGSAAVEWPLSTRAQQSGTRRIGVLMPFSAADPEGKAEIAAFVSQLRSLGWTQGANIQIDYRWAEANPERMQAFAKELIALQPDVLFSRSTPATTALSRNTKTIPIVFAVVSDPVGEGFAASFARPGGNVTGFTNAEASLTGKWLGLLKELAPAMERVAFIFDPKVAPAGGAFYTKLIQQDAAPSGVKAVPLRVHSADDIKQAVDDFAGNPGGGLIVLPDATSNNHRELIISLTAKDHLPTIYAFRNFVEEGGLMSYGVDVGDLFLRAAGYIDRILTGAKAADLPIQLPQKFEFVINLKTAKALGLTIPSGVMAIADQVIE